MENRAILVQVPLRYVTSLLSLWSLVTLCFYVISFFLALRHFACDGLDLIERTNSRGLVVARYTGTPGCRPAAEAVGQLRDEPGHGHNFR